MKAIVNTSEFKRIVRALKSFTRIDVDKMQYMRLEVDSENQEVRFEALDGHRIAIEYIACTTDESFTGYIKPFYLMKTREQDTEIEMIDGKLFVTMGDYRIGFKQEVTEWYETKKIISDMEKSEVVLSAGMDAKLLRDALKDTKQRNGRDIIIIECRDSEQPIMIRGVDDKRNVRVVLPIRIN